MVRVWISIVLRVGWSMNIIAGGQDIKIQGTFGVEKYENLKIFSTIFKNFSSHCLLVLPKFETHQQIQLFETKPKFSRSCAQKRVRKHDFKCIRFETNGKRQ